MPRSAAGGLAPYRAKRDFTRTTEPKGDAAAGPPGGRFVIQKHDATRLHYDLRLEMDGVYKSWAVTRGPSLVAGEKRLAVHVEDHPLDYGTFEGTIPKGEYGGGTVIVWDRGTWEPEGNLARAYAKGHLDFTLRGDKLSGRWHLVRIRGKPGEKRENWLLIKSDDAAARPADAPDILEERPDSAQSGRSLDEVADGAPTAPARRGRTRASAKAKPAAEAKSPGKAKPAAKESAPARAKTARAKTTRAKTASPKRPALRGAVAAALPDFVEPCLATLQRKAPAGARWLHEIKFDGYRIQVRIDRGRARLLTRTGLDWTDRFGRDLTAALAALPVKATLLDAEIVVEGPAGASDFSLLQADLAEDRTDRFVIYLFDLLHLDGLDLRPVPLERRKAALAPLLDGADPRVRLSQHFDEEGAIMQRHACRLSLEGVVSKLRAGPYRSGRQKDWVKAKCSERQEFVIGGFVPSAVSPRSIGSLVLGYYEDGELRHAGRVGTGFSQALAADLWRRLDRTRIKASPFAGRLDAEQSRGVRFVRPEHVAEVEYRGWTADRRLRHAAFRGLREDKPAAEVGMEAAPTVRKGAATGVRLTHPERVYWPDVGLTKEGLAEYYADVWKWMAPHVVGRPLALVRCPDGVGGQCFFQKHGWRGMPPAVRVTRDAETGDELLSIDGLDGATALVQSGVLEIHPWGSTLDAIDRPDTLTFDLDPGEGVAWEAVIDAAHEVRRRLAAQDMPGFVKTSGGKGLHVVVPLKGATTWDDAKAFCRSVAEAMAADAPDLYIAKAIKAQRRGRVFVDYLRNARGATAVVAYGPRARPGAAVSMPVEWDELDPSIGPDWFTVANAPARLANLKADPWADLRRSAVALPRPAGRRRKK